MLTYDYLSMSHSIKKAADGLRGCGSAAEADYRICKPTSMAYVKIRLIQSLRIKRLVISSKAPTYDFYLRELLRSELTYLLTYLMNC